MKSDIDAVKTFFQTLGKEYVNTQENGEFTKLGRFVCSSVSHLNSMLEDLINQELINSNTLLVDAGCGDARLVALASAHEIPSLGIEIDQKWAYRSTRNIERLRERKVLNGVSANISCGDFTDDKTYDGAGIAFKNITTFFNYWNNYKKIADKIAKQSPKGTLFLLHKYNPKPELFEGLHLEQTITVIDEETSYKDIKGRFIKDTGYVLVYRKL